MVDFLLNHASYLGIIVVLILTGSGLPLPEEVPVIVAGLASYHGTLNPWLAFPACLVGALLGDCVMYWIGHHFGKSVLREHPWFARFLTPARERRMERLIAQHGLKVFFLARFLVGIRSPVYLTSGIMRVPFRKFILVDACSATCVIGLFFGLSYTFADKIAEWWRWIRHAEVGLTIGIVAAVIGVLLYFYIRRRRRWARVRFRRLQRLLKHSVERHKDQPQKVA